MLSLDNYKMLDLKLAERFETKVKAYLEVFETGIYKKSGVFIFKKNGTAS